MQEHYLENFVRAVLQVVSEEADGRLDQATLVVGGDGRYHNRAAIQTIIRMAVAAKVGTLLIGRDGIISTPAMSAIIRSRTAIGGIVLSASHNPGGIEGDFGIKYNVRNGGPAPESVTERVFAKSSTGEPYQIADGADVDLAREGEHQLDATRVIIIDPIADYLAVMRTLFDFDALRALFARGFRLRFDAMHAVTGPYAHHIFEEVLGAPAGTVVNGKPLEDFGGHHPDPNQVYAADLVARMAASDAPDMGAASDGDGDRNMILGRDFFVTPGDSLAVLAEHAHSIPGYRAGLTGVARSMPTSLAVDRVAAALKIPCFETPTGWKFFGNLMDAGKITICGEESFGTGSSHIREKDGLWAVLSWLSLAATTQKPIAEIVRRHWQRFGRSYFQRHDYDDLEEKVARDLISNLSGRLAALPGTSVAGQAIASADDFTYRDPIDGSISKNQGLRVLLQDGSRIIFRLSGTGSSTATVRLYFERYLQQDIDADIGRVLAPLDTLAQEIFPIRERCGRTGPTLIT